MGTCGLHLAVSALVMFISVSGGVGNALLIKAVVANYDPTVDSAFTLILSLAVSDLAYSCVAVWGSMESALNQYFLPVEYEAAIGASYNLLFAVFCLHLIAMALNRMVGIVFPVHYTTIWSMRRTRIAIMLCWAIAIVYASVRGFVCCPVYWNIDAVVPTMHMPDNSTNSPILNVLDFAINCSSILLPFVFYTVASIRLLQLRARKSRAVSVVDKYICLQFALILTVFIFNACGWQFVQRKAKTEPELLYIIAVTNAINFSCNPFVYFAFNRRIRQTAMTCFENCKIRRSNRRLAAQAPPRCDSGSCSKAHVRENGTEAVLELLDTVRHTDTFL